MRSIGVEDVPGFSSIWTEEEALREISKVVVLCIVPMWGLGEGEGKVNPYPLWPVA